MSQGAIGTKSTSSKQSDVEMMVNTAFVRQMSWKGYDFFDKNKAF